MGILIVGNSCVGTYCRKYKIVGVSFQRAVIEDETLFNGKLVYLLEFEVEGCDKELTFMRPALEPCVFGCANIVKRISVTDSHNNEIRFIHEGKKAHDIDMQFLDKDDIVMFPVVAGKDFPDLVKDINQNRNDGERFRISDTRYYLIDDKKVLPKCMKIYLDDKVIDCTVNNDNPVRIRNIVKE